MLGHYRKVYNMDVWTLPKSLCPDTSEGSVYKCLASEEVSTYGCLDITERSKLWVHGHCREVYIIGAWILQKSLCVDTSEGSMYGCLASEEGSTYGCLASTERPMCG